MQTTDLAGMGRAGVTALERGDAAAARQAFERIAAAGAATPQLWLLLADACALQKDTAARDAALDRALALDPRNLYALLKKGDAAVARGDDRAAGSFYNFALSSAAAAGSLPSGLIAELRRAESEAKAAAARFDTHLHATLDGRGFGEAARPQRFQEALDLLAGKREVFLQQPTSLFYPRLPHIQFYERADFAWVPALEAAAAGIRAELTAALTADTGFAPYIAATPERPNRGHSLLDDPRWSALHLFKDGAPLAANADRCPLTMAALAGVPLPRIAGRSPMVLFSVLRPKTHIPPHHGMLNTRLICHLPLIVPDGCRLRVGNETRAVEPGKMLIFDDSIEHEAWNDSAQTRAVLLFEIWRPELSAEEIAALTVLYEAIGDYPAGG